MIAADQAHRHRLGRGVPSRPAPQPAHVEPVSPGRTRCRRPHRRPARSPAPADPSAPAPCRARHRAPPAGRRRPGGPGRHRVRGVPPGRAGRDRHPGPAGQPVAVAHRAAVRTDRGRVRGRRPADVPVAGPQQGQRQRSAGRRPLADRQPAPAGLARAGEQRQAIERGTDRRRSAPGPLGRAHGRADRSAATAVGDGRRTVRTLPAPAGGDRFRTTT